MRKYRTDQKNTCSNIELVARTKQRVDRKDKVIVKKARTQSSIPKILDFMDTFIEKNNLSDNQSGVIVVNKLKLCLK